MSMHAHGSEPNESPQAETSGGAGTGQDPLSVFADLESRIAAMKKAHEASAAREGSLRAREEEIARREQETRTRAEAVSGQESKLAELGLQLKAAQQELAARQEEMRASQERINAALAELAEQRRNAQTERDDAEQKARAARDVADAEARARREREDRAAADTRAEQARAAEERAARLADFEKRLSLREQQLQQREATLKEQDKALKDLSAQMQGIETGLDTRDAAVAEREAKVTEREKWLVELEASVTRRQGQIEAAGAAAAALEQEVTSRDEALAQKQAELEAREKALAEMEAQAAEMRRQREELDQRAAEVREGLAQVERERAALMERERALAARAPTEETSAIFAGRVEDLQIKLGEASSARAALEQKLEAADRQLEELGGLVAELETRPTAEQIAALEAAVASAKREAEAHRAQGETYRTQAEQLKARTEELGKQAAEAGQIEGLLEESDRLKRELGKRDEAIAQRERALSERTAELERQRAQAERAAKDAAARAAELAEIKGLAASRETEASSLREEVERLKGLLAERVETPTAADDGEQAAAVEELRSRLAETESRLADAEARAAAAEARAAEAKSGDAGEDAAALTQEIDKRDQAIGLLKQRLERLQEQTASVNQKFQDAQQRASELERELNAARNGETDGARGAQEARARAALRQERLRVYKQLLQVQARKIVAAQAAIQKRHTDCEQILSQRARLAAVAEDLARREKKSSSNKSRTGSAALVAYTIASVGLLAGLSWEVSKRIWPGVYTARAVVEMDAKGRRLSPEEVVAWQKDAEALVKDPRLMELAGERMKRRGLESLGSAADVRSMLETRMYTQSSQPGKLELELRGEGQHRTETELDTFVTSLKSLADQSRRERAGDLGLSIAQPSTVSAEPLLDKRIVQAGMVFGGGLTVFGGLGLLVFMRLSAAKRAFDAKQITDQALAEVDWNALEASYKRASTAAKGEGAEERKAA